MFGSVVAVAFQIAFRAEIHANDVFFIFLKLFLTLVHQNDPKSTTTLNFSKKKIQNLTKHRLKRTAKQSLRMKAIEARMKKNDEEGKLGNER